ncbi:VC0807 family protein [Jeotgalibacillus proteolyticus]|uniref:VC0807 family protein n=1 Tax=Jeotgalibacillus proteolyticus TaxID=2082395 RepID=UPI003CF25C89
MKKNIILLDILCYGVIPFLIWNQGRDLLGDYWAIILSTVPAIIYTVIRFFVERQFNIAGIFIVTSLLISTTVNLLSENALSMLWNQVYLGFSFAGLYLLSILFKKPLALYFMVDIAFLQGYPREGCKALFKEKGLFIWFQLLTAFFVLRGVTQNSLKAWLIDTYGADGYGQVIIYMNISGWIFSALIAAGYFFIGSKITRHLAEKNEEEIPPPNSETV